MIVVSQKQFASIRKRLSYKRHDRLQKVSVLLVTPIKYFELRRKIYEKF